MAKVQCPQHVVLCTIRAGEAIQLSIFSHANSCAIFAASARWPDYVFKAQLLKRILSDGFELILAFDDRNSVVAMWRKLGVPCAQVAKGDFWLSVHFVLPGFGFPETVDMTFPLSSRTSALMA